MSRKAFHFRLQPVLDLRDADEQRARERLASTISLRTQGEAMLASATELIDEAAEAERTAKRQSTTIAALAAQQLWRERLERHRLAAGQQLEQAEREVTMSRSALVVAHQQVAVLDRLKDIKKAAHRDHRNRLEAAETDEIALRQHHRRGGKR